MKPSTEQTIGEKQSDEPQARPAKLSFLSRCRLFWSGFFEPPPLILGPYCIQFEEPKFQGELLITIPANTTPTKLVIVGDWGDSSPEVQLVRLKQPWKAIELA